MPANGSEAKSLSRRAFFSRCAEVRSFGDLEPGQELAEAHMRSPPERGVPVGVGPLRPAALVLDAFTVRHFENDWLLPGA